MLGILSVVQLVDGLRIATGDLQPKNGEYYPRFFQTRPSAELLAPGR